ncbi:histidinol-phosphate transaminase [Acidaminobacter sp. JC074]|uniref:histidinol-phosphate transaminase n=1 Tax=Acidaminobacter sp. JC074 TaxID=2530199 RepID=UPI001F0D9116|nr:histidinol-phosphate transaminase [Acidaminobacter sp. JC074]MCH4887249.1 histidinol-phosphate transaminase [Acidaminobacter sp. JC074]
MSIFRKELAGLKEYVPGKPIEDVMKEYGLTSIVKLASNENPLGPSKKAIEAIKREAENIHIYPDGAALELREKLAKKHGISMDQVLIGSGGEQILKLIAHTFVDEGDEVIFGAPSFALYDIMSSHIGAKCISLPLTEDFKHDLKAFEEHLNEKTKIVYICNPNNPTGNIMPKAELVDFISRLPESVVLMLDEAYFEYAIHDPDYLNGLDILKERKNTIILRTFSKVAGLAGLRIGYCFSSPEIIREMSKIKGVFNANRIGQMAAIASLDDDEHIENTVALNKQSLDMMKVYFNEHNMKYVESHANFIFVDINQSSREAYVELQKRGVIIRPGFLWGFENYIRVSSGTIEQTEIFIKALDEITK